MTQRTKQICVLFVVALAALRMVHAQQSAVPQSKFDVLNVEPPPMRLRTLATIQRTPETIVESFLKAETQLRQALNQHTFKREVVLQTIGPNGEVTGQYVRNSEFVFDDHGKRIERVTYHPPSTIREMRITREDIQDLAGAQLLGIDITESAKYRIAYQGKELLAGRLVYVLNVEPAVQPNPFRMSERYFRGTVWIDAATYQMVRARGTVEPQGKQRFPQFETWRDVFSAPSSTSNHATRETLPNSATVNDTEPNQPAGRTLVSRTDSEQRTPVDAAFAFPSRTEADDVLHFPNRDVNYRIRVRYYDYKLFASTVSVKELDQPAAIGQPATLTARTRP